jgi:hypothetical protein
MVTTAGVSATNKYDDIRRAPHLRGTGRLIQWTGHKSKCKPVSGKILSPFLENPSLYLFTLKA